MLPAIVSLVRLTVPPRLSMPPPEAVAELVDNVESRTTSVPPVSMPPPEPLLIEVAGCIARQSAIADRHRARRVIDATTGARRGVGRQCRGDCDGSEIDEDSAARVGRIATDRIARGIGDRRRAALVIDAAPEACGDIAGDVVVSDRQWTGVKDARSVAAGRRVAGDRGTGERQCAQAIDAAAIACRRVARDRRVAGDRQCAMAIDAAATRRSTCCSERRAGEMVKCPRY